MPFPVLLLQNRNTKHKEKEMKAASAFSSRLRHHLLFITTTTNKQVVGLHLPGV